MRKRDRDSKIKAAREAIASCERALQIEPCAVYERSKRHWQGVLDRLLALKPGDTFTEHLP